MVLEAVMVCVDNSDYSRNGDYTPTRFEAQTDAVNLVCGAKTQQNMENSVGILGMAGDRVDVLITPTSDLGRMVSELVKMKVGGSTDLLRGIQTAQLALKHRQNKNQRQRVIAFVGSPITATERELEVLGKNLKKNNVSLDLVSFGEVEENSAKLQKLLGAVNSNDSSHLLDVPVGPKLLSDALLSSAIIAPDGEMPMGGGGGGDGAGFEFGVNAGEDPELALALRISMEEERARQTALGGGTEESAAPAADGAAAPCAAEAADAPAAPAAAAMPAASDAAVLEAMGMEDMDDELRQALLLSMQDSGPAEPEAPASAPAAPAAPVEPSAPAEPAQKDVDMASADGPAVAAAGEDVEGVDSKWFQDPSFVTDLLGALPGVDINDPRIQEALKEVGGNDEKKEGDGNGPGSGGAGGSGGDGANNAAD